MLLAQVKSRTEQRRLMNELGRTASLSHIPPPLMAWVLIAGALTPAVRDALSEYITTYARLGYPISSLPLPAVVEVLTAFECRPQLLAQTVIALSDAGFAQFAAIDKEWLAKRLILVDHDTFFSTTAIITTLTEFGLNLSSLTREQLYWLHRALSRRKPPRHITHIVGGPHTLQVAFQRASVSKEMLDSLFS